MNIKLFSKRIKDTFTNQYNKITTYLRRLKNLIKKCQAFLYHNVTRLHFLIWPRFGSLISEPSNKLKSQIPYNNAWKVNSNTFILAFCWFWKKSHDIFFATSENRWYKNFSFNFSNILILIFLKCNLNLVFGFWF